MKLIFEKRGRKLVLTIKMMSKLFSFSVQTRMFATQPVKTKMGLLGVPYNEGTSRVENGTELAPKLIREGGLVEEIAEFNENVDLKDFGDLSINASKSCGKIRTKNILNYDGFMPLMKRLSDKVQEIRAENRICVTLGGDHAIAVG